MKKVINVIKRVIIAIFMLYGLNLLIASLNIVIPINIISICVVSLLGIPGILTMVMLFLLI